MKGYSMGIAWLVLLALGGCVKSTHYIAPKKEDVALILIPQTPNVTSDYLSVSRQSENRVNGVLLEQERRLVDECQGPFSLDSLEVKILTALAGQLGDYLTGRMTDYFASRLERYTAQYGASGTVPFYEKQDTGVLQPAWRCIRLVRYGNTSEPGKPKPVLFEALVAMRPQQDSHGAVQMMLRRVYCSVPAAASRDGRKVAVQISLKAEATWQDGHRGYQETVFDHRFPVVRCPADGRSVIHYFTDIKGVPLKENEAGRKPDWSEVPRLPRIPYSVDANGLPLEGEAGIVTFNATVTESGLPPKWLAKAYDIVSDNEDALSDLLKKEAEKLGEEEDEDED